MPPFQRDYSWTESEWEELWQDIIALFEEEAEPAHYMGYLVLQSADNKSFDIIDGQQRITTLSLMILAGLSFIQEIIDKSIEPEKNQQRLSQLKGSYIGYTDPVTLIEKPKLSLNRHNNDYYRDYLVGLGRLPTRNLHASEHQLRKSFQWFKTRFEQRFNYENNSAEQFAAFVDKVVDKLFFTVITVTDELNAFKVFETLNARGVKLSSTDLLKNYLFSLASIDDLQTEQIKNLEGRWEKIIQILGKESFPEFLRIFWNSRNKLVRKSELFKVIRKNIKNKQQAFELVRQIEIAADAYAALRDSSDERWQNDSQYLEHLQMYSVRQPLSVLLACYEKFFDNDRKGFEKLIRAIAILSFRYNVICNNPPNEQERIYNNIATQIFSGELASTQDVLQALRSLYPDDAEFQLAFEKKGLNTNNSRNKKIVRYILFSLENHIAHTQLDFTSAQFTIEHILPENPEDKWQHIDDAKLSTLTYRLGNMVLLEADKNREIGNAEYCEKKDIYENSQIKTANNLVDNYNEWDEKTINSRQKHMAKQATSLWRVDF